MADLLLGDLPERNAARRGADHWAVRHCEDVLSWGELANRATRRAHALSAQGVGQGDRVVLALPNSNAFFEWTFAIWKLGATPAVVSHRMPIGELRDVVALAAPRALVVDDADLRATLGGLPADFGRDHTNTAPLVSREAPSWKVMTSGGSTGRPKLIVDHHSSRMDDSMRGLAIPVDSVMLNPGPLNHNFPFAMTHSLMVHGNSVVGMPRFDAQEWLRLMAEHRVEWTLMVPTMMSRVAKLPESERAGHDLSALATLWHTAAPITPELKRFWIDWIGAEKIWEMYGGTEGFMTTQLDGREWLEHPGSVGRPTYGEIEIRAEDGTPQPAGAIGEIFMRRLGGGAQEATYHYEGAEGRRTADGYESFGDYGWVDDGGYLFIADRRTDLILSGGRNIYPAEVEAALLAHPEVAEAIVIGLPDADMGAYIHAIVRREDGSRLTGEALLDHTAARLIAYKLPRSIEFTTEPLRDEAGKARRSRLREERLARCADAST